MEQAGTVPANEETQVHETDLTLTFQGSWQEWAPFLIGSGTDIVYKVLYGCLV